jgi:hypothetical protein
MWCSIVIAPRLEEFWGIFFKITDFLQLLPPCDARSAPDDESPPPTTAINKHNPSKVPFSVLHL